MPRFSHYRPRNYKFFIPERLTPAETNLRRTRNLLAEHERAWKLSILREAEQERSARAERVERWTADEVVSGKSKKSLDPISSVVVKGRKTYGPEAASIAAAAAKGKTRTSDFREADFADPQLRAAYRELRRSQGGSQKVKAPGQDARAFNPTAKAFPSTISGTSARINPWLLVNGAASFARATLVVPCIQRAVRREVMFALGHGGKGYHTRKRRNDNSGIPC